MGKLVGEWVEEEATAQLPRGKPESIGKPLGHFKTSCTGPTYHGHLRKKLGEVWERMLDGAVVTAISSIIKIGSEVSWKRTLRGGPNLWELKLGSTSCEPGLQQEDTLNLVRW